MNKPDMKDYYNFRSLICNLYDNDTYYGDLCGSVLYIRDKNRCINSMSTKIQDHAIVVEFDDNTETKKKFKIADDIKSKIGAFLSNNIDNLVRMDSKLSQEQIEGFINSPTSNFCDTSLTGNTLVISL